MQKKKHLHIVSAKVWGGGETYIYNLSKYYKSQGNELVLICDNKNINIAHRLSSVAKVIPIDLSNKNILFNIFKISKIINDIKVSTINYHSGRNSFLCYSLSKISKKPCYFFKHNITKGKNDFYHQKIYSSLENIICVSNQVKSEFLSVLPSRISKKTTVIHNAVFIPKQSKAFDNHKGKITIGFSGRIVENKGILPFLDAISELPEKKYDIIIAGTGNPELLYLINNSYSKNNIHLLGELQNMDRFYREIDILVAPSIVPEAFGLSICEAMSYGKTVISSSSGAQAEIISNLVDGILIDRVDKSNILQKILFASNTEIRKKIQSNARNKINSHFSISRLYNDLENIYNKDSNYD